MYKADLIRSLSELKDIGDLDTIRAKLSDIILAIENSTYEPIVVSSATGFGNGSSVTFSSETKSAIIVCVEANDADQLESILERFPSVDLSAIYMDIQTGVSALHRAVELGNEKILNLIFKHSDSIQNHQMYLHELNGEMIAKAERMKFNKRTKFQGYTPLHFSVMCFGGEKIIFDLIKRGGDPNLESTDERKITPFLLACETGNDGAAKAIIQATKGQCLDATDSQGNTGLHLAVKAGNEVLVSLLMNVMPELSGEINDDKMTPIQLAKEAGHTNMANLIERIGDSK